MDITSRCVIAVPMSGLPGIYHGNRKKSQEVCQQAGASSDAGKWADCLFPREAVERARKVQGELRALVCDPTKGRGVPWIGRGQYLVLASTMMELSPKADALVVEFCRAADASTEQYDHWVAQARKDRGKLFRDQDYRGRSAFRRKFKLALNVLPVQDASHIICDLAEDDLRVIREGVNRQVAEAASEARQSVITRLVDPLRHMAETLKDEKAVFRDSLVNNLRDIGAILPDINIFQDATISGVHSDVCALGALNPQGLRDDKWYRMSTASKAEAILSKLQNGNGNGNNAQ